MMSPVQGGLRQVMGMVAARIKHKAGIMAEMGQGGGVVEPV
jgi:hypothetical protein